MYFLFSPEPPKTSSQDDITLGRDSIGPIPQDYAGLYTITDKEQRHSKRFRTTETVYKVSFTENNDENGDIVHVIDSLFSGLRHLINTLTEGFHPNDMIQLTIWNRDALTYPITLPFMPVGELDLEDLLLEIQLVLQSNEAFTLGENVEVRLVTVCMPRGGRARRKTLLDKWLKNTKSLVCVRNTDFTCMARAIGIALAKVAHDAYTGDWGSPPPQWIAQARAEDKKMLLKYLWGASKYRMMRRNQRLFAEWLHQRAGVDITNYCGLEEAARFQNIL